MRVHQLTYQTASHGNNRKAWTIAEWMIGVAVVAVVLSSYVGVAAAYSLTYLLFPLIYLLVVAEQLDCRRMGRPRPPLSILWHLTVALVSVNWIIYVTVMQPRMAVNNLSPLGPKWAEMIVSGLPIALAGILTVRLAMDALLYKGRR